VEVTALTWACDSLDGSWRTFCATLDGSLAEVRWRAGKLEASSDSGAGAIWSLAAQPAAAVSPGGSRASLGMRVLWFAALGAN